MSNTSMNGASFLNNAAAKHTYWRDDLSVSGANTSVIQSSDRLNAAVTTVHSEEQHHFSCASESFPHFQKGQTWYLRTFMTSASHLKWSIFDVWALPVKRCHGYCAYQVWAGFLEAAVFAKINLEDQPTSGLEIEMSKFTSWKKKKTYIGERLYPNICNLLHDCLLHFSADRDTGKHLKGGHVFRLI